LTQTDLISEPSEFIQFLHPALQLNAAQLNELAEPEIAALVCEILVPGFVQQLIELRESG
jgi:hypothetical protein